MDVTPFRLAPAQVPLPRDSAVTLAIEIMNLNRAGIPATPSTLVDRLSPTGEKDSVYDSLDTLVDWGVIKGQYQEIGHGQGGYCYVVTEAALPMVEDAATKAGYKA